ncbi:MAG: murein hydrolase activator EnvC [Gemmatimonadota bacterium]
MAMLALVLSVAAPCALHAQDPETELQQQRQRLQELQREISRKRSEAARLGRTESSVLNELADVERELGATRRLIETLETEIETRAMQIDDLTRELALAQDELAIKRQILARRLRSIYKLGRYGGFEILLMGDSFAQILGRYKILRLVAGQDQRLVRRIATLERETRRHRAELEAARTNLTVAHEERVAQAEALTANERDRERVLRRVKNQRAEQLRAADALEEETERLQQLLATLERRRTEREALARREAAEEGRAPETVASTLSGEYGSLDWPVDGDIIARFGRARHPVYNTEIVNNGIDIRAARGTRVRAVEAGKVVYVDWYGGYGLTIIVDHDGGYYSLYAHLDRAQVSINQQVARGGVVGTVGESGSLEGPKLHFEIRQGVRAIDPVGWLRRR